MTQLKQKTYPQKTLRKIEVIVASIGLDPKQKFLTNPYWESPRKWTSLEKLYPMKKFGYTGPYSDHLDAIIRHYNAMRGQDAYDFTDDDFRFLILLMENLVNIEPKIHKLHREVTYVWEMLTSYLILSFQR